ncbi:MAG: hypothetical protein NT154_14820 [Verrucomicrobia bacterium]|nr:hypothetical protein [Verrucomicrobiota bacterium]
MNVVVFTYDYQDARFHKRLRMFRDFGFSVSWLAYSRNRNVPVPPWVLSDFPHEVLGITFSRRYGHRFLSILKTICRLSRKNAILRNADLVYCISPENLVTAGILRQLKRGSFRVVYELADVMPAMAGNGIVGKCGRLAERWALANVPLVTVASPAYLTNYLQAVQDYRGKSFLLENKILSSDIVRPGLQVQQGAGDGLLRVGLFGHIKCRRSLELIGGLARDLPEICKFTLRGTIDSTVSGIFHRVMDGSPNVEFGGPYQYPVDLPEIYGGVDLAWGFDFCDTSHNSRWCLANRTYEAGFCGVPLLIQAGTANGELVERLGIGWSFEEPLLLSISRFLKSVSREEILRKKKQIAALDADCFVLNADLPRFKGALQGALRPQT